MKNYTMNQAGLFDPTTGSPSLLGLIGATVPTRVEPVAQVAPSGARIFEVRPETIGGSVGDSSYCQLSEGDGSLLECKRIFARCLRSYLGDWRIKSQGWERAELFEHVGGQIVSLGWMRVDDPELTSA